MASNNQGHKEGEGNQGNQGNQGSQGGQGGQGGGSERGFASMDPERQREIASAGGRAAHEKGTAHEFTSGEAREAGRKGGEAVSQDRQHMAEIGLEGGKASGGNQGRGNQQGGGNQGGGQGRK